MTRENKNPTVFHITHWKAGSQWVRAILAGAQPERTVPQKLYVAHVLNDPIRRGLIYPGVYLTRDQFSALELPGGSKRFIVIRDLRDTLISWYFSMKESHPMNERVRRHREAINALDFTKGLIYLMDTRLPDAARIQSSWIAPDELILRYEQLLSDEETHFARILSHCRIHVSHDDLAGLLSANSFEMLSGRKKGMEDPASHHRKAIAGDWRNYFSNTIKREFNNRFGPILIQTGYERNSNW